MSLTVLLLILLLPIVVALVWSIRKRNKGIVTVSVIALIVIALLLANMMFAIKYSM